jgi:hypothetical protein
MSLVSPSKVNIHKTHILISIANITNLDQHGIIDKTPFYFQPTNPGSDSELALLCPELQTYRVCVKRNFYYKCAGKSYDIFKLIESNFTDIIILSQSIDISFNYSMTAKIPKQKYKLVMQALINWFSPSNWWQFVYPAIDKIGVICLTNDERHAINIYPKIVFDGLHEKILTGLCRRIDNIIQSITKPRTEIHNTNINKHIGYPTTNAPELWIKFGDRHVSIRSDAKLKPSTPNDFITGKDVIHYLIANTGFKKLCRYEYQGFAEFLIFNTPQPDIKLCLSAFIRDNKLIAVSQTDLAGGYSARLAELITYHAAHIIQLITNKWQKLISPDGGNLEYKDVVLTVELIQLTDQQSSIITELQNPVPDIQIWDIEMGYGAWTSTRSKLFTWAELELLTGSPPVIKLMSQDTK